MVTLRIKSVRNYYPHLLLIAGLLVVNILVTAYQIRVSTSPAIPAAHGHTTPVNYSELSHDGLCECDGMDANCQNIFRIVNERQEVKRPKVYTHGTIDPREYQIELDNDGAYVYDGRNYLGFLPYYKTCNFFKMMDKDNQ